VKKLIILFFLSLYLPSSAQFVDFGRNKVQYSDFEWNTMSTEHFKIYYYKEAKELAEQGAYFAEEQYKNLVQKFNHSLYDTVPIIFYASPLHFKQTNTSPGFIPDGVGGFFEFVKGRVVIPFEGSIGQFQHVIAHELVHVFMTSKILSQQKIHGQVSERMPPLWFTEGLAEYWSTKWDTQAEMVLKDAVINNYIVGLDDWENFYGTYLMYKLGQKVIEYIAQNYGEDKVLQLQENFWMDDNFSTVMEKTIGKDYKAFDRDFLYYLKKMYLPDYADHDNPSQVSKNIFSAGFAHKPTFSDFNGKKDIYYIGNQTGYTSIYKTSLSQRGEGELVVKGESSDDFEQFHFFRTGLDVSSKGVLAFITQKGDRDAIHLYDVSKEKLISDFSFDNIVNIGSPTWSKDGKLIAFPATDFGGRSDLYILNIETEALTRLTNDYYDERDPDFSPDGKYLVFSSDRTSFGMNKYNLFLYELSTHAITYLTIGDQIDYNPRFSPDGSKVVFTSTITGEQNIWMIDLNKNTSSSIGKPGNTYQWDNLPENLEMKRLTNFITAAYDPDFAGDDKIIFSSYEYGSITIRMLDNVSQIYDTSKVSAKIDYTKKGQNWDFAKIESNPKKNQLKYTKDYALDIASSSISSDPVFGTNAGGIISLSDVLSNEKYYILLFNNSDSQSEFWKSFNIAISKVSLEQRLNYAYGIYHLSGKRYDLTESDVSYYERIYGGYLSFSYPLSFFKRIETSVNLAESNKNIDFLDNTRSLLLSNTISYVHDNTLWTYTGPIDGERFNLTLGYTSDIDNSNSNYYSILLDYRKYFRISNTVALAFRGQYFMNEGKEPRRFFMGGSWSLRGWDRNSLRGSKLWQSNLELRFPFINALIFRFPLGINLGFPGIRGALYVDAGNTWDNFENYGETKGSIGGGLRLNLFGFIGLRYDIGKRIEKNFTKLQSGLYQQFYFGWDF